MADSVNGTRMPIFSSPSGLGAGAGVPAVQADRMTTSATRSAGPTFPALLDDRLFRGVDELVGVGLREIDVRVLDHVVVELLEQAELEFRGALQHLSVGAEHAHAVLERLDVAVLVAAVVVRRELLGDLERGVRPDPFE